MGEPHQHLTDVATAGFTPGTAKPGPDRMPRSFLSEFERAQVQRIAEEGGALAAAVVRWHREQNAANHGNLEQHLSHGLGVAALGALVMQLLAWTRLVEPAGAPPATLRAAREIIDAADPEAEPAALDTQARSLLIHAMEIKAKARRISRLW
ncbi:hypothetical protein H261_17418 [Paramagnetospirillum caucaseum]|uniref:Uncharacterized protein n=1 Tax=Paramagnetospirillum caucaseum TaxID=1244869 RepID=M2Y6G7_9PROT|nr:hypothetical protein [Paramagnetospirillum caucaseum]EME68646.1 hypothetical protein H261_17418 [Paramagnetospirillum caucaseum]